MDTNRRNFLIQSGATLGVLGAGYVLWAPGSPPQVPGGAGKPPSAKAPGPLLQAALQRMKEEHKPGVAFRIPVQPDFRHEPGHYLTYPFFKPDDRTIGLFAQAVFICLESATIQDMIRGANPAHAIVLFDASLCAVDGIPFGYSAGDWERFVPALTELVQGKGGERLKARADSVRVSAPSAVVDALDRLDSEGDRATVKAQVSRLSPLLVHESRQPTNERRKKALLGMLRDYVDLASAETAGPKLPFGIETTPFGGCGDGCREQSATQREIAIECGMGRVRAEARHFLRYLGS